jgi:Bifunctional DNA primase/polymerase, N-terminal
MDERCGHLVFKEDDQRIPVIGLGVAALAYLGMGFAVLPLAHGGKRPHSILGASGGVHHATRDPAQVWAWWRQSPVANVGIATGSPSNLAIVDLDIKSGGTGPQNFAMFLAQNRLPFPAVPYAITPSGGKHLYLRTQGRVPHRPGILPSVDVLGDGGLAVAAPSMLPHQPINRPGERGEGEVPVPYEWALGCACSAPPWPGWMAGWLASAGGIRAGAVSRGGQDRRGADSRGEGLAVGRRNRDMYALACSMYRRLGTSPDGAGAVLARLREVWERTDRVGFGWSEVLVCSESARRFIERSRAAEDERNAAFLAWLHRRG